MRASSTRPKAKLIRENLRAVKQLYPHVTNSQMLVLRELSLTLGLSVRSGDLLMLDTRWYVTHSGLLRVAQRRRCSGITTELEEGVSTPKESRWVFKATVAKSETQHFVGYGDADPSNVSFLVHGAEMRVAETRAVNRALRKAYGIGICSIEEIGSFAEPPQSFRESKKLPPQPVNGNNGNYGGEPKVRDRLCQLIRHHQLDPNLVKSYAVDYCGTKTLREASREQVEGFAAHLADWAEKDRERIALSAQQLSRREGRCGVRRYFESLRPADVSALHSVPDGLFLVRVDRAQYRWHKQKPYYEICFPVLSFDGSFLILLLFGPPSESSLSGTSTPLLRAQFGGPSFPALRASHFSQGNCVRIFLGHFCLLLCLNGGQERNR